MYVCIMLVCMCLYACCHCVSCGYYTDIVSVYQYSMTTPHTYMHVAEGFEQAKWSGSKQSPDLHTVHNR